MKRTRAPLPLGKLSFAGMAMIWLLANTSGSCERRPASNAAGRGETEPRGATPAEPRESISNDRAGRGPSPESGKSHLLIGYWQSFTNGVAPLPLGRVPLWFDVINVAFGVPASPRTGTIVFEVEPEVETKAEFVRDIGLLHKQGRRVVLSIGGESPPVFINTAKKLEQFVSSVSSLVREYGFDGVDIDFEGRSLTLDANDKDFKNPRTLSVVNLISAMHTLKAAFGSGFIISYSPETLFLQQGLTGYGGVKGCYLPVIYGTRDILTYIHTQDYNSGTVLALDRNLYAGGTADFHVAMTEFLLLGFVVDHKESEFFPALRQEQVAFGIPASVHAAESGLPSYTSPSDVTNAINYLVNGTPFPGHRYTLIKPAGYSRLAGVMVYSINWDATNNSRISSAIAPLLHGSPGSSPR